jgi:exonuclease SbcD
MWLVDLGAAGELTARQVPVPQPRALARLHGRLEELLTDEALAWAEDAWVQATLTDPARPAQAMEKLRARFPHTLQLLFEPEGGPRDGQGSYGERVRGRDDAQIATGFVHHVRGTEAVPREIELLRAALESAAQDEGE